LSCGLGSSILLNNHVKEITTEEKAYLLGCTYDYVESVSTDQSDHEHFPFNLSPELAWSFLRGYFEHHGKIAHVAENRQQPSCVLSCSSKAMKAGIKEFCAIPCLDSFEHGKETLGLEWYGNNALDFLGNLYENAHFFQPKNKDIYLEWAGWIPGLSGKNHGKLESLKWVKLDENAVAPFKERVSDSGFDLTLIKKAKQIGKVELYDTGIKVQPSYGWYLILAARSSIIKSGYMLANGIGIIDRSYVGPILVPLIKIDPDAPDLPLPNRLVQLIPTPIVHGAFIQVEDFEETARGAGGFGSTGL
jgi:deoxyuridine 5'-triphosphate nucleotidohydrolase